MKLKHYFVLLIIGIVLLAGVALFATFRSHPTLFYISEGFVVVLLCYLWYFYRKTIRPYDTLIGGMELVKDLDLTTRLAPSGQHETDVIVRTFNDLLGRLRSEHLRLEEQYTFLNLLIEASPMGVIQCDLDGNTTSMNHAAREMLSPSVAEAIHALPLGETTTVRMIAHEVNNSVAGIIGSLTGDEAERLTALSSFVSRFAEVVKIPQPQLQLCDLSEEVEACRPFLENLCTQAHVHIDFRLTDEAVPVHLDTVLFQQVLINIVKNAVESIGKATGSCLASDQRSSGRVSGNATQGLVILEATTPATLTITDNGHGIPPAIAKNLFTPFFSTKPQGQGLGLLLIRDILTSHHCTFNLLTDPEDHLTRFTIQFPART